MIGDTLVTVAPHSEYVSLFQSTGLIGLALMIWLIASMFRRNIVNVRSGFSFSATVGLLFTALLAAQATYFISYSAGLIAGMIVGLSASLAWFGALDPEIEALKSATADTTPFPEPRVSTQLNQPYIEPPILP